MRKVQVAPTTIAVIAGTRIMLGMGLGMLVADKFDKRQRHSVGWTLFLAGAAATVPLVMHVLRQRQGVPEPEFAPEHEFA